MNFDRETLHAWHNAAEVDIETSRADAAPRHRTTIWIVVDGDTPYIRSVRGERGRWYREMLANPQGAVHTGGKRTPVTAELVTDAGTIERVSELLNDKYKSRWPDSTASMLQPDILSTTLRLSAA